MKIKYLILLSFIYSLSFAAPATLRLDYSHTGDAKTETFGLNRIVMEPLAWAGNPSHPIDDTNLGPYLFEVVDSAGKKVLYSRGYASVFNEWQSTAEAGKIRRTFEESLRFPAPDAAVEIVVKRRDAKNAFQEVWSIHVDPSDPFIDRSKPAAPTKLLELQKSGDPAVKVDFLILGDGYTAAESAKFEKDAKRLIEILFTQSPFKEHRADFNVWGLCPPAEQSGISRPSTGIYRKSPVGASYDAFGSERYVLTFDNRSFREIAQFAPYEFVEILTNSNTYGGGGIYNLYSTVAADSLWSPYVFVHEFGHHFAALADEYYTSDVAYEPSQERIEPWEPNVTALLDPSNLKWKDLIEAGTPLPTPWDKEEFEKYSRAIQERRRQIRKENRPESEMDALFTEEQKHESAQLGSQKYAGKVGAFEGAIYEAKGYYRPQADCIMFTRDNVPFCAVCQKAIERIINLYSR